jgi:hypothetical protein
MLTNDITKLKPFKLPPTHSLYLEPIILPHIPLYEPYPSTHPPRHFDIHTAVRDSLPWSVSVSTHSHHHRPHRKWETHKSSLRSALTRSIPILFLYRLKVATVPSCKSDAYSRHQEDFTTPLNCSPSSDVDDAWSFSTTPIKLPFTSSFLAESAVRNRRTTIITSSSVAPPNSTVSSSTRLRYPIPAGVRGRRSVGDSVIPSGMTTERKALYSGVLRWVCERASSDLYLDDR